MQKIASGVQHLRKKFFTAFGIVTLLMQMGCELGKGQGWIEGQLWVENCKDGNPLGSLEKPAAFDLHADFFPGEPKEDSNPSAEQRRNILALRIQNTSNNVEVSDGLFVQFNDLDVVARNFAQGQPTSVTNSSFCSSLGCSTQDDALRVSLYLYASCHACRQPLVGASYELSKLPNATDPSRNCLQYAHQTAPPAAPWTSPCPNISPSDKATLDAMCTGDFNDRESKSEIERILGGGACLYLCQFGTAQRGQDPEELQGYSVDYGDRVAALFSVQILDGRAVEMQTCAMAHGHITGQFNFEVVRGRAAQSFP